jgi:DNA-binding transcriptional MerR regulator
VESTGRFSIGELADIAGVSRRTVRYYVQEGLLPSPFGVGRGNHYGTDHLNRLLRVKTMQQAGRTLDEIRQALSGTPAAANPGPQPPAVTARSSWRRIVLAPGVELHVESGVRLPDAGKLEELAAWCRSNFPITRTSDEDDHA